MQLTFADSIQDVIRNQTQKHHEEVAKYNEEISILKTEIKLVEDQKVKLHSALAWEKQAFEEYKSSQNITKRELEKQLQELNQSFQQQLAAQKIRSEKK